MTTNTVAKKHLPVVEMDFWGRSAGISRIKSEQQNKGNNEDRGGHYRRSGKKIVAMILTCIEDVRSQIKI